MKKSFAISIRLVLLSVFLTLLIAHYYFTQRVELQSYAASNITWSPFHSASFDTGDFSEWDQINAADGTMTIVNEGGEVPHSPASSSTKVAKAYQQGSNTTDGHFSRTIWNLPGWTDQVYASQAYYYLPTGFYDSMQGAVQLMGWDTNPVLGNQMRLIIYNSDKKARLFINEDYVGREITNSFTIPEGQWVKIRIEQRISATQGWSEVYMDDVLVAQGNAQSCGGNATGCTDTLANAPVTRMRYGLVAIADQVQLQPVTVYFDDASMFLGSSNVASPSPSVQPSPSPSPSVQPSLSPSPVPTPTPSPAPCFQGDLNDDRTVNVLDFAILHTDFFKTTLANPRSDINRDGVVNIFDFSILVNDLGKSC